MHQNTAKTTKIINIIAFCQEQPPEAPPSGQKNPPHPSSDSHVLVSFKPGDEGEKRAHYITARRYFLCFHPNIFVHHKKRFDHPVEVSIEIQDSVLLFRVPPELIPLSILLLRIADIIPASCSFGQGVGLAVLSQ